MSLQTTSTPADFEALAQTDFSGTTCVVLDILRATSSMITALANGAEQILPVATIEEALAAKTKHPEALLCGERNGLRITATQTGGTEFDFGNSPCEYTAEAVAGRILEEFPVDAVQVRVKKPRPPIKGSFVENAVVEIYRVRDQNHS